VNLQDVEIVERVQQGISNPAYRGGRMCYQFEESLHRYQNIVIDRIPPGDQETSVRMFRSNGTVEGT
jgi:choline monooxygenase